MSSRKKGKGKGKVCPITGHECPDGGGGRCSSTLSFTSAMGVDDERHAPAAPGKESRYALYRGMGVPQNRSGRVRKISPHRDSIPDCQTRNESLNRLSHPVPLSSRKVVVTGVQYKRQVILVKHSLMWIFTLNFTESFDACRQTRGTFY
jgi:hypothetical protein